MVLDVHSMPTDMLSAVSSSFAVDCPMRADYWKSQLYTSASIDAQVIAKRSTESRNKRNITSS